jgi:hypothetical protein
MLIEHPNGSHHEGGTHRDSSTGSLERVPLLDAATAVTVSIEILAETYQEILAVARASGYDEDEAVRTVLLSGLGYESGRLHLDTLNRTAQLGTELSAERVDAIVSELAGYHSMYSVLKYKAFKLYKQNQRLTFNNAGLRAQEKMWNEWADRVRRERDAQDAELLRLRSILSEFALDWEAAGGAELPRGLLEAAKLPEEEHAEPVEDPSEESPEPPAVELPPSLWARLLRFLKPG